MSASEKQFEDLRRMIHCLDKPRFDHFMRCLQLPVNGVPPAKAIGIVTFLKKNKEANLQETFLANYKGSNKSTFMKQVIRIKEKLFSSILDDENIHRPGSYTACTRAIIEVRKNTMIAKLFPSLTFEGNLIAFLDKNIAKAKKFELFDELIELLHYKKQFVSSRYGVIQAAQIYKEIEYYTGSRDAVLVAFKHESRFNGLYNSQSHITEDQFNLKSAIAELKSWSKKFKSTFLEYHIYNYEIKLHLFEHHFEKAEEILDALFEFRKKNSHILNGGVINSIEMLAIGVKLQNCKFRESLLLISKAKNSHGLSLLSIMIITLFEFYNLFYQGNYDSSRIVSEKLLLDSTLFQSNYFKNLFKVIKSVLFLLDHNYHESNKLLTDLPEFEKDKAGWNLGVRLLRIMNYIEMDKLDTAELQIESMRKHIERTEKSGIKVRKRDKTILKILIELVKQDFSFKKTMLKKADLFTLLGSTEFDYCWEMMKHEMIVFHVWFKAKAEGKEYDPCILNHPKDRELVNSE